MVQGCWSHQEKNGNSGKETKYRQKYFAQL